MTRERRSRKKTVPDIVEAHKNDGIESKLQSIREWINGPGEKLLQSQRTKPYNFEEAQNLRKAQEQLEFKCMKALEGFASICERRKRDYSNEALNEVDYMVQNFVDRLSKRTFFVVSCYSYFRSLNGVVHSMRNLDSFSREVDTYDAVSIRKAINDLERGCDEIQSGLKSAESELKRLQVILDSSDPVYIDQLEHDFVDMENQVFEQGQELKIRKLILQKQAKLLECETNIGESIDWLEELMESVDLLYTNNCVGKNQVDSAELMKNSTQLHKQSEVTYRYSCQLLETYIKLCEADGRRIPRTIHANKNRLAGVWPRLDGRVVEFNKRLKTAQTIYLELDNQLGRVEEYLIQASFNTSPYPPGHISRKSETILSDEERTITNMWADFHTTKSVALSLLEKIPKGLVMDDSAFTGAAIDDVCRLIRLKLYTLWLKLRELEYGLLGYNTTDDSTAHQLGLDKMHPRIRSKSQSRRHSSVRNYADDYQSPASPISDIRSRGDGLEWTDELFRTYGESERNKMSSSSVSRTRSAPPTPPPVPPPMSSEKGSAAPSVKSIKQGENIVIPPSPPIPPSHSSEDDREPMDMNARLQDALEQFEARLEALRPPGNQVGSAAEKEAVRHEADRAMTRLTNYITETVDSASKSHAFTDRVEAVDDIKQEAKRILEVWSEDWHNWRSCEEDVDDATFVRLIELEADLGECQSRLYELTNSLCLITCVQLDEPQLEVVQRFVREEDVRTCSMIRKETDGIMETMSAQHEFISTLMAEAEASDYIQPTVERVDKLWKTYRGKVAALDEFSHVINATYNQFSNLQKLNDRWAMATENPKRDRADLIALQNDALEISKDLNDIIHPDHLQPAASRITRSFGTKPKIEWLDEYIRYCLNQLNQISENLGRMLTNRQEILGATNEPASDMRHPRPLYHAATFANIHSPPSPINDDDNLPPTPPLPPRSSLPMSSKLEFNRPDRVPSQTFLDPQQTKRILRITQPLKDVSCRADDQVILHCQFSGSTDVSKLDISWTFEPMFSEARAKVTLTEKSENIVQEKGINFAQLIIKQITASSSGKYTVRISKNNSNSALKSSATVHVYPYLKKELVDANIPILDARSGLLSPVMFAVEYTGFTSIPTADWTRMGQTLDINVWHTTTTESAASIFSNTLDINADGLYECCLHDPLTGYELISTAQLTIDRTKTPKVQSSLVFNDQEASGVANRGEQLIIRCPLPTSIDLNDCQIDWLHYSNIIYTYRPHNKTTSENTFQCGRTKWRTYVSNGNCILATNAANLSDEGEYICRIISLGDVYESEGKVSVAEPLKFVEPLLDKSVSKKDYAAPIVTKRHRTPQGLVPCGHDVTISVCFQADPCCSCDWMKDGIVLDPQQFKIELGMTVNTCYLTLRGLQPKDTGVYRLRLENLHGYTELSEFIEVQDYQPSIEIQPSAIEVVDTSPRRSPTTAFLKIDDAIILVHPSNLSVLRGETANFMCVLRETSKRLSVAWFHAGKPLQSANDYQIYNDHPRSNIFQLRIKIAGKWNEGDYRMVVIPSGSDPVNAVPLAHSAFHLHIRSPSDDRQPVGTSPQLIDTARPGTISKNVGDNLQIRYCVSGYPKPECFWIHNRTRFVTQEHHICEFVSQGQYNCQLNIPNLTQDHGGSWELICHNQYGSLLLGNVVQVIPKSELNQATRDSTDVLASSGVPQDATIIPPELLSLFSNVTCKRGAPVKFTCRVTGRPIPTVHWTFNGELLQETGGHLKLHHQNDEYSLSIDETGESDAGRYSLVAENVAGITTCSALLVVSPSSLVSPISEPGYRRPAAVSPDRSRRHSGTQTPITQRVSHFQSVGQYPSVMEQHQLATESYPKCLQYRPSSHKHHKSRQPANRAEDSDHVIFTTKGPRALQSRIPRSKHRINSNEMNRHKSDEPSCHNCPQCGGHMRLVRGRQDSLPKSPELRSTYIYEHTYNYDLPPSASKSRTITVRHQQSTPSPPPQVCLPSRSSTKPKSRLQIPIHNIPTYKDKRESTVPGGHTPMNLIQASLSYTTTNSDKQSGSHYSMVESSDVDL